MDTYAWVISDGGSCIVDTDSFITVWSVRSAGEEVTVPARPGFGYDYTITWGDGSFDENVSGDAVHVYAAPGTYEVSITGTYAGIYLNNDRDMAEKLVSVEQWGTIVWQTVEGAFFGASDMVMNASDIPDLSNVTSMADMFRDCRNFRGDATMSSWDVSNVTDMSGLFAGTRFFNQDISSWTVDNVTDMSEMFSRSENFNQPIGVWDVSNVTDMSGMFFSPSNFNQDISGWNVSNVTDMSNMFDGTFAFNQPIGGWNVGNVANMSQMFRSARRFDQPLDGWDVSNVTDMSGMFEGTSDFDRPLSGWVTTSLADISRMFRSSNSFDQDLGGWDVSNVTDAQQMFEGTALSTANYDALLIGWSQQVLQNGVVFGGGRVYSVMP